MRKALLWSSIALLCACNNNSPGAGDSGMQGAGDMAMMMGGGNIPDPGNSDAIDQNIASVEPNDTPAQATPLGTAKAGDIRGWINGIQIGGGDNADYFVFRSGPMAGQFTFDICWSGNVTSMTAELWKVVNGQQVLPSIHQWTATSMMGVGGNMGCVMTAASGDAPLEANPVYLFGVTATGGAGMYFA